MRSVSRRHVTTGLLLALVVLMTAPVGPASAARSSGGKLSKHDRQLLSDAVAADESRVTVLIASIPASNRSVASGIAALGGAVVYVDDALGYIRADVPVSKVEATARISGVQAVDLDELIPIEDPRPGPSGSQLPTPQPPPSASTPNNNPYMPIGDTGVSQFMAAHPTWDGRGTTIGILDSGIDLHHPSLQTTSTGERKIVDWVTSTAPFTDDDPTWVNMATQVNGPTFTVSGVTYTAPASGSYRFGLFDERDPRLGGEMANDVNKDGNPAGSSGTFAILWSTGSNDVWVDTNQDNAFGDQAAMTDYKVRFDVGAFGSDNAATPVREAMPFVVQTDGKNKVVNIGIVSSSHGSHVAGIAAGNALFGGAMTGAAPGAKIVSVRVCLFIAGCTSHALIEGMIYAARQANVDVINMSIGGLPSLNDGNNARAILYDRLIDQSKVQMFISAGNSGPGANTVGDPSVATKVMSVGAYITKATWQSDYGSDSSFVDNLHPFSSRGPREDGGFKPQIVAPGAAVSTVPEWYPAAQVPSGPAPGAYTLPVGYDMFNGTSMASPQATGAAAVLISAAKQAGALYQPAQLRMAMNSSARYLDPSRIGAYEQGNGLIDVGGAWTLLSQNLKTVEITSAVEVHTLISGFLATPNVGVGIHDREGVKPGDSYTRQYTFTRRSGGSGAITYNLSWVGNDGTFSSPSQISLPLNTPVGLTVNVNAATPGPHSAILRVDDPVTPGTDHATMNAVFAAKVFTPADNYSITESSSIGRNQYRSSLYRVPVGAPALSFSFSGPSTTPGTGQARFLRYHPYGVPFESSTNSLACYSPPVTPGGSCVGRTPTQAVVSGPTGGAWEATVEARRTSDVEPTPYSLTTTILGASVSPNPDIIASATIGSPVARSYTMQNLFGAFTGRAVGTTLGSARRGPFSIGHLQTQEYPVTVTAGSTSLRATIGNPSDPAADLDLFVYRCTAGPCVLVGQSADGDSEESVTIANPAAGSWLVVIDGFSVPAGTTTYDYVDVFTNPAFGSISVTDANALRPAGSSWTAPATVTANAVPGTGRVLLGNVQVRTDTNVLVGQGDVIIQSVSP